MLLKSLLIARRNDSIRNLDRKYNEHIAKLLDMKSHILRSIERHFDEQMRMVHREEIKHHIQVARQESASSTGDQKHAPTLTVQPIKMSAWPSDEPTQHRNHSANVVATSQPESGKRKHKAEDRSKQRKRERKKWKCDVCSYSTDQRISLTRHTRVHTGDKPFKCDHCGKMFRQKCDLKRHIRVHTGERPFKCDCCPKGFTTSGALNRHMRIHTGQRPFQCPKCKKRFRQTSHRNTHVKRCAGCN